MDIQTYLEQGKQALAQGQGREAAIAYAHGAQIDAENPMIHLGLAEANLALGRYDIVQMACRRVQELQPTGGLEGMTAQAILDLQAHNYDRALQYADAVIKEDPSIAYIHALRAHLLQAKGQTYDANLARARAARLSYGGRFDKCFPSLGPKYEIGYRPPVSTQPEAPAQPASNEDPRPSQDEPVQTWSRPNQMQRQLVRTRFFLSRYPGLFTYLLIIINVIVFLIEALNAHNFINIDVNTAMAMGAQNTPYIQMTGEYWRIFTSMFIHFGLLHIALNMLSLYFIGRVVEMVYGPWRYLTIYFLAGIAGGIVTYFFQDPNSVSAGASGAIFGVFGALGVFYFVNRHALGAYGRSAIANWLFWMALNFIWNFSAVGISITDHIGGLLSGMLLAYILLPRLGRRRI
jgi:membrane associated rhomboid family serine protease